MNILIFHSGALGDLVNTLPAISALRRRFPGAVLTAVGRPDLLALPLEAGLIDEAVALERPGMHLLFAPGPAEKLPGPLREWLSGFDLAVSWVRSPELIANLGALGIATHFHPGPFPPPAGSGHATEHMMLALRGLGIDGPAAAPRLPAPGRWPGPRFPGIIVHPGSGSRRKNWPAEKFAQAATILADGSGLPFAVLAGPADGEAAAATVALLKALGHEARLIAGLTLPELAGMLASARLLVGNDSGVAHLAGSVGAPVVAVFGPSDPARWGVRQAAAVILRRSDCVPCFDDRSRVCQSGECFAGLTPEAVAEAGAGLLSRR